MEKAAYKAFLSHQSKDREFVRIIAECLMENGVDVFLDEWDIMGGDSIPVELERGIIDSNIFLYVLSPTAVKSKWVQQEYHSFLYRKINEHELRIIPILREDCEPPPFIAPLRQIDFRKFDVENQSQRNPEEEGALKELLSAIFRRSIKPPLGPIHPAMASYELYFQKMKNSPINIDSSENYELGFKNLTDSPLHNFAFTIGFAEPVQSVEYDFPRSSANMTGGDGLSPDRRWFNWLGNQIMEDGGWAVFIIKSKAIPKITTISTKLVGRFADTRQVIPPDSKGLKQ